MQDSVTIGVPVYRGERFLEETLHSIQRQTHTAFNVIMSIDSPDPLCEAICAKFLGDPRFEIVVQPQRRGWVGNLNWLLAHVTGDFWYFHQQDDLTDDNYIEVLIEHARAHPSAALVYCDITPIGRHSGTTFTAPSVLGVSPYGRVMTMLQEHFPAFAFRGLTRADAVRDAGPIPMNAVDNFGVDITWLTAVACSGELHRVPRPLYRKRYHDNNTESRWWSLPRDEQLRSWAHHCVDMLGQTLKLRGSPEQSRMLWLAAAARLTAPEAALHFLKVAELGTAERRHLLAQFLTLAEERYGAELAARLDADWPHIRQMAQSALWIPRIAPVEIAAFGPEAVRCGAPFNEQPGGASAVWLKADRVPAPGSRISLNGVVLDTVLDGTVATALVPSGLTSRPGRIQIFLIGPDGTPTSKTTHMNVVE